MPPKKHQAKTRNHAQAAACVTSTTVEPIETVRVLFQAGILDPLQLSAAYTEIIDALANGYYKSVTFKKLRGYDNIYAARVNISDRLLFTFEIIDGKRYLVLIGVIDNHAYEKSSLLTPGGLKQFLIKYRHAIHASLEKSRLAATPAAASAAASSKNDLNEEDDDSDFSDVDIDNDPCLSSFQSNQSSKSVEFWPSVFFKDKFNPLSLEQKLLQDQGFPKLCTGPAGSGKSCAAFVEMEKALAVIRRMKEDDPEFDTSRLAPIAYVTQSPILLRQMKKEWEEMHPSGTIVPVKFQTYDDFLLEQDPTLNGGQVDDDYFKAWLKGYLTDARKKTRAQKTSTTSFITTLDPDDKNSALFEELEIIAGCASPDDYLKLGNRECQYAKDQKPIILELYKNYTKYLNDTRKYDPRLLTLSAIKPNNLVTIIDEGHDLSQRELLNLSAGTVNNSICVLMDPYQRLNRLIPTIPFVEQYFTSLGKKNVTYKLTPSFRCPKIMTDIATSLINARNICATGIPIKDANTTITSAATQRTTTGEAHVVNPDDASAFTATLDKLRELAKIELVVIITPEEYREGAERKFPGFLVLTPSEAKGMEYDTVVMFRCFTGQKLSGLNKMLSQNKDATAPSHRSKNAEVHVDTRELDKLYVCVTRALSRLYLLEADNKDNTHILSPIKHIIETAKTEPLAANSHVSASSENREVYWLEEIKKLILSKQSRQINHAKLKYLEHQIGDEASFNTLLESMQAVSSAVAPLVSAVATTLPMTASPIRPAQGSKKKLAATGLSRAQSEGIQNLLNNFTPNNVTTYLKLRNAHDLFFNHYTTASEQKVLFLEICKDKSKLDLLIDCLDKNEALYNLFSSRTFYKNDLFDNNTQCPDWKYSIFHMLCENTENDPALTKTKHTLLITILRNNSTLYNIVSSDTLTSKVYAENKTAFKHLVTAPIGRIILHSLISNNPWIVDENIAENLFDTLPFSCLDNNKTTFNLIDGIMRDSVGASLVCECIATRPEILLGMPALLGWNPLPDSVRLLLKSLSTQRKGRLVLNTIARTNTEFLPLLNTPIMDTRPDVADDLCYPDTPFTFCVHPITNTIKLIESCLLVECCLEEFTVSNLEALLNYCYGPQLLFDAFYPDGVSLFQQLVEKYIITPNNANGLQPFLDLLAKKPEYASLFTKERLETRFKKNDQHRASNLCVLLYYGGAVAVKMLTILLKNNQQLGTALSLEALTRVYFEFRNASNQPCSPLSLVLQLNDHLPTLGLLSTFCSSRFSSQTGSLHVSRSFLEAISVSRFFKMVFASSQNDQHLFMCLLFGDQQAVNLLTPDLLLSPISDDRYKRTVLQTLVSTKVGRTQFFPLLLNNIKITEAITRTHLTESFEHRDENNLSIIQTTSLIKILSAPENQSVMKILYEKNPKLRDHLTAASPPTMFQPAAAAAAETTRQPVSNKQAPSNQVSTYLDARDRGLNDELSTRIRGLLNNFIQANLIAFLKHKNAYALFFYPYKDSTGIKKVLFLEICSDVSKLILLINTLIDHKELYSLFIASTFFLNDPSGNEAQGTDWRHSIFYMLCNSECNKDIYLYKHQLLCNILYNDSTILNAIASMILVVSDDKSTSPFIHLLRSPFGIKLLYVIFSKNPWVVDNKIHAILIRLFNTANSPDVFIKDPIGRETLRRCIATNPDIYVKLDDEHSRLLLQEHEFDNGVTLLLGSLLVQKNGRPALDKIVRILANPAESINRALSSSINDIMMNAPTQVAVDLCYPDTAFVFWAVPDIDGENLVADCRRQLTTSNLKALFNHPNNEVLLFGAPYPIGVSLFQDLVVKYLINGNDTNGFHPFFELLTINPKYTKLFTKANLETRFKNVQNCRASNLCVLLYYGKELALKILTIILMHNPHLRETLSLDALTRLYFEFRETFDELPYSPLSRVLASCENQFGDNRVIMDMLNMLLEHYLKSPTPKTMPLDIPRAFITNHLCSFFIYACLSSKREQHQFLFNFFSDPNVIKILTPELLLTPVPCDAYKSSSSPIRFDARRRTAFQALTSTEVGLTKFIPHILRHNIKVSAAITSTHLYELYEYPVEQNLDRWEQISLYKLLLRPENRFILELLYEKNPKLLDRPSLAPMQTVFQPVATTVDITPASRSASTRTSKRQS